MNKAAILILSLAISHQLYGQDKRHEIGLELSPIHGRISPSINYLFSITPKHQLDFTGSFAMGRGQQSDFISSTFSAYYKRKFNIIEGLSWYVGPGASLRYGRVSAPTLQVFDLGIGAQIGLEYDFSKHNVPIVFGMDIKPEYHFGSGFNYFGVQPGASVRFKF